MKTNLRIGLACAMALGVSLSFSALANDPSTNTTTSMSPPGSNNPAVQEWKKAHPGQVEVNSRLRNQNERINQELQSGQITQQQAQQLHQEDMKIRGQAFQDAAQNGGKLTPQQVIELNRQENQANTDMLKAGGSHPQN